MFSSPLDEDLRQVHVGPLVIRWLKHFFPLIMLGLAVHLLLPQLADLKQAWQTVLQMPRWLVGLALAMEAASYAGSGYLLASLAGMLRERVSVVRGMLITLASGTIGLMAGGIVGTSAATYRWLTAGGVSSQAAALCGTLPSLFNNLLLTSLAILGLVHLLIIHRLTRIQAYGFGLVLAALTTLVVGSVWAVTHPERLLAIVNSLGERWAKVRKRLYSPAGAENNINQIVDIWIILIHGGWRGPALGAFLNTGFDMLSLYLLFLAAGYDISFGMLLTGYGLPLLIGKVGFLPGGVGIVEATMTALYISMGVPNHVAVVVVLGYRLISFWIPTLLGIPLAFYFQRTPADKSPTSEDTKEAVDAHGVG